MNGENDSALLNSISCPQDLQGLSKEELEQLAFEIRQRMVEVTSLNGGHLAPSLGAVEITMALHLALDSPTDKIIWDVGHQAYAHKILTGRNKEFATMRLHGGISGFPRRRESPHDIFDTGHASSSLSAALGVAIAQQRQGDNSTVAAVIGDGSLTGGMAYEAMNQIGELQPDMIVILNDNEMSICDNVGAISSYLNRIRLDPAYNRARRDIEHALKCIPAVGERVASWSENVRTSLKQFLVPGMFFEELGFKYIGPVDGHDIEALRLSLMMAKQVGGPIMIHALTKKGKGYAPAEANPDLFHGTAPFNIVTGERDKPANRAPTYTSTFGRCLLELAGQDDRLVAVTAAMAQGTGLEPFSKQFPDRFFDVGIAEQHAVTFAAGMATAGKIPIVAIYSTFLQRAFDQVIEDVCLQKLPVILAVDRGGLVGDDGATHHGAFDLSYLGLIPYMTVMAPKDENELCDMLYTATKVGTPVAIRYPRGAGEGVAIRPVRRMMEIGKSEILREGKDVCLIGIGRMVSTAVAAAGLLAEQGVQAAVVNARFLKPIDSDAILRLAAAHDLIVTLEDNVTIGGFGSVVSQLVAAADGGVKVVNLGLPDTFVSHGSVPKLMAAMGLDATSIAQTVTSLLRSGHNVKT